MTEEQFKALPESLQIWALRENTVIYKEFGIIPSPETAVVAVGLELGKDYPQIMHKNMLKKYSKVTISTLLNLHK